MSETTPDIRYLFEPRSVAVIGASHDESKIGYNIVENMVNDGYSGMIYPVNPKGGTILGNRVYTSIEEIDGEVDLAAIVIPARFVYDSVVSCGRKGVKFLIIISSGFSEVGNRAEEKRIVDHARSHGMRVLGPNIFGIYCKEKSLNCTFGPKDVMPGNVSILTQSGALGIAMVGKTALERIGLSSIISLGNKADLDESDLLEYLQDDENTSTILMYIEGVQNGDRLVRVLKRVTRKKPVIAIKSGSSKRGAVAAASHTGSLAGSDKVFDQVMRQCGVLRAESIQEALYWCRFLADAPIPPGENNVIITNGGGIGVMATDACEKYDIKLLDDTNNTSSIFSPVTPGFGSTKNPIDLTGGASSKDYDMALDAAVKSDSIHSVIALYCATSSFDMENLSSLVESTYGRFRQAGKPIVFSLFGGDQVERTIEELRYSGIPVFNDVYDAVETLGSLYRHYNHLKEKVEEPPEVHIDTGTATGVINRVREDGRTFLLAHEARELMDACGIAVPGSMVARSMDEAVRYAEKIGYPVVMKIVSKDIIHKSDAGGVALDLQDRGEVIDAYQAVMRNAITYDPDALIEGVEVVEMVKKGVETIVGARMDNSFGPVMMFGLGGIYVEVMKDVSFRALPLTRGEIMDMIKETRSYPLLLGVRGEERKDMDKVVDTILKLGALIIGVPGISDIEINPLVAYDNGEGVKAVDVRVLLSKDDKGGRYNA